MGMTVRTLVGRAELGVSLVAGARGADRRVTWVLTGEQVGPGARLTGTELVLTAASRRPADGSWSDYVRQLAASGASALGLHTADDGGLPADAVDAAEDVGLPLLHMAGATSGDQLARVVARAVVEDQQRDLAYTVDAQRDLCRALQAPNPARELVERLAKALQGWALLLDEDGHLRAGSHAARGYLARLRIDLARLRDGSRSTSLSMTIAGDAAVLLPLAVRGRVRGFLAAGRSTPLGSAGQAVVATAAALLCAELRGVSGDADIRKRHRLAVFTVAVQGDVGLAARVADVMGVACPEGDLRVAMLGAPREHAVELLERAENDHALRSVSALVAEWEPGRVAVLIPPAEGDVRTLESLLRQVPHARGAVSDAVPPADLSEAWRRVRSVFNSAPGTAGTLALASDVATAGLMRHLATDEARGWAEAVLAPLGDGGSKIDLRHTLRTFLAHNGQADASATALGIHRHTLRYRMGKVAEALGRDIDDPTTRAELWVALQLDDSP